MGRGVFMMEGAPFTHGIGPGFEVLLRHVGALEGQSLTSFLFFAILQLIATAFKCNRSNMFARMQTWCAGVSLNST
jgi:hypothetical protein